MVDKLVDEPFTCKEREIQVKERERRRDEREREREREREERKEQEILEQVKDLDFSTNPFLENYNVVGKDFRESLFPLIVGPQGIVEGEGEGGEAMLKPHDELLNPKALSYSRVVHLDNGGFISGPASKVLKSLLSSQQGECLG